MFSQTNTPLLCEVIPVMDALQKHFDEFRDGIEKDDGTWITFPEVIRHGAARASVVLSKYYGKTDESEVYRIAMRTFSVLPCHSHLIHISPVLHPKYKTHYWKRVGWEDKWIETGIQCGRDVWEASYAPRQATAAPQAVVPKVCTTFAVTLVNTYCHHHDQAKAGVKARSLFETFEATTTSQPTSQFDDWVSSPPIHCSDPIVYWTAELNSPNAKYKELARMALDYLSIPGMYSPACDSALYLHVHI